MNQMEEITEEQYIDAIRVIKAYHLQITNAGKPADQISEFEKKLQEFEKRQMRLFPETN